MEKVFKFAGYENKLDKGELTFHYILELPSETLNFAEKLKFSNLDFSKVSNELIIKILDALSLVLGISYWKTYCLENIDLGEIKLNENQADFWNALYINGLGEFFYKNKIDFTKFNLFKANTSEVLNPVQIETKNRSLLAIGGGKDSIVSGELLNENGKDFTAYVLGSYPIQDDVIRILNIDKICINRVVDSQIHGINKRSDSLNGHIPISAIYRFVGVLTAALFDYKYLIMSNERSSNYGSVEYLGKEINHQWSKSQEFEKMFQNYINNYVTPDITSFSLLRPMNEIKIVEIFSKHPEYFSVFSSCNRNFKIGEKASSLWCGECPKCLFVFVCLAAFLPKEEVIKIFGQNLFENENLSEKYKELLGTHNHKPFDCIGTPDEVKLAFYLVYQKKEFNQTPIMKMFIDSFEQKFTEIDESKDNLLSLSSEHSLPEEFKQVLNTI